MNIVLTGFMASGKTTTAKALAKLTGMKMVDTDELIEEKTGMTINRIFAERGEDEFRKIENEVIKEVSRLDNLIISTGGGVPLNPENIVMLRTNGIVFNLCPEFGVIESRIAMAAKTRPLLQNQTMDDIKKRFDERRPFYNNCDYAIHINSFTDTNTCVKEILRLSGEIAQKA